MQQNNLLDTGKSITAKQAQVLALIVEGATVAQAAEAAGISRHTIYRWIEKDTAFAASLERAGQTGIELAAATMRTATQQATGVMIDIMNDTSLPAAIRLRAASEISATGFRWTEYLHYARKLDEYVERVAQLEEALQDSQSTQPAYWSRSKV